MYSFRQLRDAILAPERPGPGFPFGEPLPPAGLAALRDAPHLRPLLNGLRAVAEEARGAPVEHLPFQLFLQFETQGERGAYDARYFARRRRLAGLALVTLLDGDDTLIPALEDLIWAICEEYTWALPAHLPLGLAANLAHRVPPPQMVDLFAAETAHALAEILYHLGDRLNPWVTHRVREEVERRVFAPMFDTSVHFGWEAAPHNWAAVCCGATGMAALLLEPSRERLAGIVERVVRALECFLEGYGDDGGCPEGIAYWVFGFGYYVCFAEMLHAYTDGQIDLLAGEKLARIAAFPAAMSLGGGQFVNYADAGEVRLETGLMSRLAHRLGAPVPELPAVPWEHDRKYSWASTIRNLLWTDPALLGRPTPEGASVLPDLGWVVHRGALGGTPVAFSARGGHNGEPHNHNDLGHFIISIGDESLLADIGAGRYTRDYFHGDRYSFLHASSEGHSVPLIAGRPQRPGPEAAAKLLDVEASAEGARLTLDLTAAYDAPGLHRVTRGFDWRVEPGEGLARLELTDRFAFDGPPGELEERFISLHRPELGPGSATWRGRHGSVELAYSPERFAAEVEMIETSAHHNTPQTVYRLRLRCGQPAAEGEERFTFTCRAAG